MKEIILPAHFLAETSLNTLYEQKKITKENYKRKKAVFFNAQHKLKRKRVKK